MKHLSRVWMAVVVVLVGGLAASSVSAAALGKVAFADVAKVFDEYQRTKESDKILEGKSKAKEGEMESKVNELKKLREGLELLSDKAKDERQKQIEEKADELQRFRLAAQNELRRERDNVAREILKEIDEVVQAYAKAQSYDLILNERTLIYATPTLDVTNDILKQLNDRHAAKAKP